MADGGPVGAVAAHRSDFLVAVGTAEAEAVARGPRGQPGRVAVLEVGHEPVAPGQTQHVADVERIGGGVPVDAFPRRRT